MEKVKLYILKHFSFGFVNKIRTIRGLLYSTVSWMLPFVLLPQSIRALKYKQRRISDLRHVFDIKVLNWAESFFYYEKYNLSAPAIKVMWADGPQPGNFGDWLSPYIVNRLTNRSIVHVKDYCSPNFPHILCVGSILLKSNENSFVVGAGVSSVEDSISSKSNYLIVRGPHTNNKLNSLNINTTRVTGDLGFIMPKIYKPQPVASECPVLFVRHITHQKLRLNVPDDWFELSINAAHPNDIENFIDRVCGSRLVVTSAMHCYIVCKAYDIPVVLIGFKGVDTVYGDGIKYFDAMEGIGLKGYTPIQISSDLSKYDFTAMIDHQKIDPVKIDNLYAEAISSMNRYIELTEQRKNELQVY